MVCRYIYTAANHCVDTLLKKLVEMAAQSYIVAVFLCVHLTQPTASARYTVDAVAIKCGDRQICDGKVEYCDRLTDECVPCWQPCSRKTSADIKLCRTRCAGKLCVVESVSRKLTVRCGCGWYCTEGFWLNRPIA